MKALALAFALTAGSGAAPAPTAPTAHFTLLKDIKAVLDLPAFKAPGTHVVHFWASWCGPCRMELPEFLEKAQALSKQGVDFTFLSGDDPSDVESAAGPLMTEMGGFFPGANHYVLSDKISPEALTVRIDRSWHVASIPATFVFRDGKRIASYRGDTEDEALDHVLPAPTTSPATRSPSPDPHPSK